MAAPTGPDRLLAAAIRLLPAARRDWGRAMRAEMAAIDTPAERWRFARGCVRAVAVDLRLLRTTVHLLVVLITLGALLTWIGTVDYPPLATVLAVVVSILAAVCWAARRAGMFGPIDDGPNAWLLRGCGYLIAGGIVTVAVAHLHPATPAAADAGVGVLVFASVPAGFLIALATVLARRSAATTRVLVTGAGSGLVTTLAWLLLVVVTPPVPASAGLGLAATAVAAATAVLANGDRSSTARGRVLAALLASGVALALIFGAVELLAHWGPDRLIPRITPYALPADRVSESRIELVDPYVLLLVLSGVAAAALGLAGVVTRRPVGVRKR